MELHRVIITSKPSLYKYDYTPRTNILPNKRTPCRNLDLKQKTAKMEFISFIKDVGTSLKLANNQESPQNALCTKRYKQNTNS